MRAPAVPILRVLEDTAVGRFLREAHNFFTALRDLPRLWGVRTSVTFTGAGTVSVVHGLGRVPQGYIVEGLTASMVLSDGGVPTETAIPITSTAAGTARLWIF